MTMTHTLYQDSGLFTLGGQNYPDPMLQILGLTVVTPLFLLHDFHQFLMSHSLTCSTGQT